VYHIAFYDRRDKKITPNMVGATFDLTSSIGYGGLGAETSLFKALYYCLTAVSGRVVGFACGFRRLAIWPLLLPLKTEIRPMVRPPPLPK